MVEEQQTGNIFWVYFTFLSVISLSFLALWSINNQSLLGVVISLVFGMLIVFTHLLSRGEVFTLGGSFRQNALAFTLGFWLWGGLIIVRNLRIASGAEPFSILNTITPTKNLLFAQIAADLPQFWQFVIDQITNPFIEEGFWLIGLPFGIIFLFDVLSSQIPFLEFLETKQAKFVGAFLISTITFPLFHVGLTAMLLFVIAAFMFRSITIILYWGDELLDLFPNLRIIASTLVGMHMANNWFNFGFFRGIAILASNFYGIFIILSLALIFLAAADFVIEVPFNMLFTDDG